MDKLRENPRPVVAALIVAGIAALIIGSSSDTNTQTTDVTQEANQTQSSEEAKTEDEVMEKTEVETAIGSEPSSGPVKVEKDETTYKSTVRAGDNQTVIVRQMVNDYLSDQSKSLSPEQRLFVETTLVGALPRNDVVFVGEQITIPAESIASAVEASATLTEAQLALWAQYL